MNSSTTPFQRWCFFSTISLLIFYVVYRAYSLSLTYDECLSYEIVLNAEHNLTTTANNHLLNTFLMRICYNIWGNNEFVLRLPNVLAFGMYLFFSIKILLPHRRQVLLFITGFSLLLLNPFILDFFSLARGYGLSLALFLGGFYYITKPINTENELENTSITNTNILLSLFFASLATLANLTMINFLITIIIAGSWKHWRYAEQRLAIWKYLLVGGITGGVLYMNLEQLLFLKNNNELYHGSGALLQAYQSIIHYSLYLYPYDEITITSIMVCLAIVWAIGLGIVLVLKDKYPTLLFSVFIFFCMLMGLILEHFLFGAKYPSDRTALLYFTAGVLLVYHTLVVVEEHNFISRISTKLISLCITAFLIYNFSISANLSYCNIWKFDYPTKQIMRLIYEIGMNDKGQHYTISNTNFLTPGILYYKDYYGINMGYPSDESPENSTIFIYSWSNDGYKENYTAIASFEANKHTLFIRNDYLNRYTNHRKVYD